MSGQITDASSASALAATGITPERLGSSRAARLNDKERTIYGIVLRGFADGSPPDRALLADGSPPDRALLAAEAAKNGLALDGLIATLAREDLVHLDADGRVAVAYPFSGRPTRHRVCFDGHEVFAMCAIDALGIAPMLDLPIEVRSSDPLDGQAITVSLAPDGTGSWQPEEAVVVTGSACEGAAFKGCCQVLNFFASPANAERYLHEHADVRGFPISIPKAIELGSLIFRDALPND